MSRKMNRIKQLLCVCVAVLLATPLWAGTQQQKDFCGVTSVTWTGMVGTPVIDNINLTVTGKVRYGIDMTDITVTFEGTNLVSWISVGPPDFTHGPVEYLLTSTPGDVDSYLVTLTQEEIGSNPILYLYKSDEAYTNDGVFRYLQSQGKNIVPVKAAAQPRSPEEYAQYEWVLISEDADGDNAEIRAVTLGASGLPVLNMKSFSYSPDRLGWGEPDNGSLTDQARSFIVQRADHPIFQALGKQQGQPVEVLSEINKKGLMPVAVHLEHTLCLATAYTRNIDDYDANGPLQTFLHEVPAAMRGGKKYICMPIALSSTRYLTSEGFALLDEVIRYLTDDRPTVDLPFLQINSFRLNGVAADIDQMNNTISLSLDITKPENRDLTHVVPEVTVADPLTHVVPLAGEEVDMSTATFHAFAYEVTDYINRRVYEVRITTYNPLGIDEVYRVGDEVTVYDLFGRRLMTTTDDVHTLSLPRGAYIGVTADGASFKFIR